MNSFLTGTKHVQLGREQPRDTIIQYLKIVNYDGYNTKRGSLLVDGDLALFLMISRLIDEVI